jgi:ribosomal protein L44E
MANRLLTEDEIKSVFTPLIKLVRDELVVKANGDDNLLWALRRKLAKELVYDERDKPMVRKKLKLKKKLDQLNKCAECFEELPSTGTVLDRLEAMKGYNEENTRVLCPVCDAKIQKERGYR